MEWPDCFPKSQSFDVHIITRFPDFGTTQKNEEQFQKVFACHNDMRMDASLLNFHVVRTWDSISKGIYTRFASVCHKEHQLQSKITIMSGRATRNAMRLQ